MGKNDWIKNGGKLLFTILGGLAITAVKIWLDTPKNEPMAVDEVENETDIPSQHNPDETYWNEEKSNWEKNGEPYTYRVTYKDLRDKEIHTRDYDDVDNGYEQYQWYDKQWWAIDTKWDFVPPEEN